jgi:broad specificity phosphatase PhoE
MRLPPRRLPLVAVPDLLAATLMSAIIYLVRHGQTTWNAEKRLCGQTDVPLSALGHQQSRLLAEALSGVPLAAIYTSALQRSIDTARPTAESHRLESKVQAGFNEMHYGSLEGRLRDERDPQAKAMWERFRKDPELEPLPGAETYRAFIVRVIAGLQLVLQAHCDQKLLIVGHRAVNRVVLGALLRLPMERWQALQPRSSVLYRICCEPTPVLETIELSSGRLRGAEAPISIANA